MITSPKRIFTRARLRDISCLLVLAAAGIAVLGVMDSSHAIAGSVGGPVSPVAAVTSTGTAEDSSWRRIDVLAPADPSPPPCNDQLITILNDNFDTVMPPALPGWTAINAIDPDGILWQSSNTGLPSPPADSLPNAAWVNDPPLVSDKYLDSPTFYVFEAFWAQLTFRHNFNLEASDVDPDLGFDGAVLEISSFYINNGEFTDITDPAVGGSFITGGYNRTISSDQGSPIAGRRAWSGNSGGFITTTVSLPTLVIDGVLRWRMASDNSGSGEGWRIDNVTGSYCHFEGLPTPTPTATARPTPAPRLRPTPLPRPTPAALPVNSSATSVGGPPTPTPRPRRFTPYPRPTPP
jgi:hypothetical protein